jgi:hypothetical protein
LSVSFGIVCSVFKLFLCQSLVSFDDANRSQALGPVCTVEISQKSYRKQHSPFCFPVSAVEVLLCFFFACNDQTFVMLGQTTVWIRAISSSMETPDV